jgi:hypothetical protein
MTSLTEANDFQNISEEKMINKSNWIHISIVHIMFS